MQAIQTIYDDNHQIYGAPKIAKEMQKKGEKQQGGYELCKG